MFFASRPLQHLKLNSSKITPTYYTHHLKFSPSISFDRSSVHSSNTSFLSRIRKCFYSNNSPSLTPPDRPSTTVDSLGTGVKSSSELKFPTPPEHPFLPSGKPPPKPEASGSYVPGYFVNPNDPEPEVEKFHPTAGYPLPRQTVYNEPYNKHQTIVELRLGHPPLLDAKTFVAPSASVIGHVFVREDSSIWYGAVVRADINNISIGHYTNIQEGCVITESFNPLGPDHDGTTVIGHYVTVGKRSLLNACTVEDLCMIGMGSKLQAGSYMEKGSMLGAGSVLAPGVRIPSKQLWVGNPAKFVRELGEDEIEWFYETALRYADYASRHKQEFDLPSTLFREAENLGFQPGWRLY